MSDLKAPRKIPDHPLVPAGDVEWIESQAELDAIVEHARQTGSVAYDTEFIGEASYFPHLCLVQLATPQRVAVIDALADVDVSPIWRLLADASVQKIVHAGQQDLEPVVRHLGRSPVNLNDTQIMAGLAALPYPLSLRKLLDETGNVRLGKALTFTSWDERPLSKAHVRYAADDVRYLPLVHAELSNRLETLGHVAWARAACEEICEAERYRFDPVASAIKIRGAKGLTPAQFSVLLALVKLRDAGARRWDCPSRTFLRDEVLMVMARRPARTRKHLASVRGLPQPIVDEFGDGILQAIEAALADPVKPPPVAANLGEEDAAYRFRADGFWAAVQAWLLARGVDPSVLVSRTDAMAIQHLILTDGLDAALATLPGWRRQVLEPFLAAWVRDGMPLELRWSAERGIHIDARDTAG